MRCARVLDLLSAYADSEVSLEMRHEIAVHLEACADCATELDAIRSLTVELVALEGADAPLSPGWDASLAARAAMIDEELAARPRPRLALASALSMAAALLVGVFAGAVASRMMQGEERPSDVATLEHAGIPLAHVENDDRDVTPPLDSAAIQNVGLDRSAAIEQAGAFALDSFLVSQDLRSAALLPGADDSEKLGFIDRELELLNLEDRATQVNSQLSGLSTQLSEETMRIASRVHDLRTMLESARTRQASASAVLLEISNQSRSMLEQSAGLTDLLKPTACVDLGGRCSDPRFRTVALATLLRRNALRGEESLVRDKLDQLRAVLGDEHPYARYLSDLWVPVAGLRAGKFREPMKQLIQRLDELGPCELKVFITRDRETQVLTGEGFQLHVVLHSKALEKLPLVLRSLGESEDDDQDQVTPSDKEQRRILWQVRGERDPRKQTLPVSPPGDK